MRDLALILRASRQRARRSRHAARVYTALVAHARKHLGDEEVDTALREAGLRKLTEEVCAASARNYKTRGEWAAGDSAAYQTARRRGWLNKCCAHMLCLLQPPTLKECKASARKYKTRTEWMRGDKNAYQAAYRNGWMEQCCGHMLVLRSFRTRKECKASASRFKTRTDWAKSDPLAHDRARRQGWMEYCCAHMAAPRHPFTREECVASARKYKTRSAWARGEGGSYNAARNNGWLDECCAHMPPPKKGPTPRRDWTKEECKASALRFKTRKRWYEGDQRTYAAAYRNGWLDECCAHMGPPIKGRPRKP